MMSSISWVLDLWGSTATDTNNQLTDHSASVPDLIKGALKLNVFKLVYDSWSQMASLAPMTKDICFVLAPPLPMMLPAKDASTLILVVAEAPNLVRVAKPGLAIGGGAK
jgi:hypothetical protein